MKSLQEIIADQQQLNRRLNGRATDLQDPFLLGLHRELDESIRHLQEWKDNIMGVVEVVSPSVEEDDTPPDWGAPAGNYPGSYVQ